MKAEELTTREVSLDYREKRMAEEKQFLETQVNALTEEVRNRNDEIINLRREQTSRLDKLIKT